MGLSKISLPVLDAFESSSASILSLRLGFLDKSNLSQILSQKSANISRGLSTMTLKDKEKEMTCHVYISLKKHRSTIQVFKTI